MPYIKPDKGPWPYISDDVFDPGNIVRNLQHDLDESRKQLAKANKQISKLETQIARLQAKVQ